MEYTLGGLELASRMEPLWKCLTAHHEAVSPDYNKAFFQQFTFEKRMERLYRGDTPACIIIAHETGEDAGFILAVRNADGGEVSSLYVSPSYRGAGVGNQLMTLAVDWLKGQGAETLYLTVTYGNERAFGFYAKHGFFPRSTRLLFREEG